MTFSLTTRLIAEFLGTAIMVMIGNGSVANVELKGTKGSHSGWVIITIGYGMAVMIPALMIGKISGNHINPAFTIGLAVAGDVPLAEVLPYILVQFAGAIVGQFILYICFKPHYDATENPDAILGTFSTTDATNNKFNGFVNEFLILTKGYGIINHTFKEYGPINPSPVGERKLGVLVSMENGKATAYGLGALEDRGIMFIEPGAEVYEGMIVGLNSRGEDLAINVCKEKHLTNTRASGSDDALRLVPPIQMSLEKAIEFIHSFFK